MEKTYAPNDFLRLTSNALLAQYFNHHGILGDLKVESRKQADIDAIAAAIRALPEKVRHTVDKDFRAVWKLSNKTGTVMLFEELILRGQSTPEFKKKNGYTDRALWTFMEHREVFDYVSMFVVDKSQRRFWKRYYYDKDKRPTAAHCDALSEAIAEYFQTHEARADFCAVEHHHFQGREYYFAYPSDHSQTAIEWYNSKRARRTHQLAFPVIFVAYPDSHAVEVYHQGTTKVIGTLSRMWVRHALADPSATLDDAPAYDLDLFRTRTPDINISPESPIGQVAVHRMRFTTHEWPGDITEFNGHPDRTTIYDKIQRSGQAIDEIRLVGLEVRFRNVENKRLAKKRFDLSARSADLEHEGRDATIRQFLRDSGIEIRRS